MKQYRLKKEAIDAFMQQECLSYSDLSTMLGIPLENVHRHCIAGELMPFAIANNYAILMGSVVEVACEAVTVERPMPPHDERVASILNGILARMERGK